MRFFTPRNKFEGRGHTPKEFEDPLIFGLCVGHDALFTKYSHVLTSVIMVKDRSRYRDPISGLFAAACENSVEHK